MHAKRSSSIQNMMMGLILWHFLKEVSLEDTFCSFALQAKMFITLLLLELHMGGRVVSLFAVVHSFAHS